MFKLAGTLLKLMLLPIYIPLYLIWAMFGRALGGQHQVYDMWKWS